MRHYERRTGAALYRVPVLYRSPYTLASMPTAGDTELGLDLVAMSRALSGEHPQPRLLWTEAQAACALIHNVQELWASEIADTLGTSERSAVRYRQKPASTTTDGGDPMPTDPDPKWRDRARCRGEEDPDLFFPTDFTRRHEPQIDAAKRVCAGCPVRDRCREEALADEGGRDQSNRHGILGGLTPGERLAIYHRRRDARRRATQQAMETAA